MKAYIYRCTLIEVEIEEGYEKAEDGQKVKCKLKTTEDRFIDIEEPVQNIYTNNSKLISRICGDISYLSMNLNRIGK